MTLRVVVYAEGGGETHGAFTLLPAPGAALGEEWLGPAHILARSLIAAVSSIPEQAVQVESPLRIRGRIPRGSDLLHRRSLRQLVTWARPTMRPELVLVFLDADGDATRKRTVEAHVEGVPATVVIAVAVQEFEAWLVADGETATAILGVDCREPRSIEGLAPRAAKELLASRMPDARGAPALRRAIAERCDLDVIASRCPAFVALRRDLAASFGPQRPR